MLVSPELGEVLAEIIHRVRGGHAVLPLVRGYDRHERVWNQPMPLLFQRPAAPRHAALDAGTLRRFLNHILVVSGLTDAANTPLTFSPHDFRRLFATDALRSGLVPAENVIRAGQATCSYSRRTPPRRSRRWMSRCASRCGSVIGSGSGASGRALAMPWCGRWVL